jgi:hypothetical protein
MNDHAADRRESRVVVVGISKNDFVILDQISLWQTPKRVLRSESGSVNILLPGDIARVGNKPQRSVVLLDDEPRIAKLA